MGRSRGIGSTSIAAAMGCVLSLASLAVGAPARGQAMGTAAPGVDTVSLTLEHALDIAAQSNPAYRKAENDLDLNSVEMRSTWFDQVLPKANVTLFTTGYTGNIQHRARDNFGNPIERPTSDWTYFSSTQQLFSLSWDIQGASIFQRYRAQKITNRGRDVAATKARRSMQVAVRRWYTAAMKERDLLKAEEDLVEARRLDKDVADRLFGLALKTRVDVLNAELGIQKQIGAMQQQRTAYEKALLALRTQLGDDNLGPIRLAEAPVTPFDPSQLDADALVKRALAVNPALQQAQVSVDLSKEGMAEARTLWWPTLSLGWNVGRTAQTQEANSLFDMTLNEPMDSRFYAQISFPMFNNFFQNRKQQAQASIDLQNAREDERQARLNLEEKVRGALLELENQYQSLQTNERAEDIAQEALRLAREEYRLGTRTFTELRSAINDEADARRQVIQARYAFMDQLFTLEDAVGTSITPPSAPGGG
ncbi:MAG: TolC family protein [Gemmatimonadetes bacterium]|nr:TolC family protein [Gemmatimonadota bacterium]